VNFEHSKAVGQLIFRFGGINHETIVIRQSALAEPERSNQIKSDQIRSNQIKSDQIRANQIKSDQIKSDQIRSNQGGFCSQRVPSRFLYQFVISVVVDCRFSWVNHSDSMARRVHVFSSIWLARQPNSFRVINQAFWNGYGIFMDMVPTFSKESIISNMWTSSNFADGLQRK
jgi:hypothetical protein